MENRLRLLGIRSVALTFAAISCLIMLVGFGVTKADAATPVILNTSSTGGQTNWLENFTVASDTSKSANRIWLTLSIKHDPGRSVAGIRIDDDYNGTDNTAAATLRSVTNQRPNVVGGFGHTRVSFNYLVPTSNNGLNCNVITGGTATSSVPLRVRAELDNGEQTATTSSDLRWVRHDCTSRDDMPYLFQRSQSTTSTITPGTEVDFTVTGDDTDSGLTGNQTFGGINWRARRLSDGATTGSTLVCWGGSDNTQRSFSATFPNRGRWVVEAQLRNENDNCGANPNSAAYFYVGAVDVNTAAANSPTIGLNATRPQIGGNSTVTATIADPSDNAQGGRVQAIEWDLDQNTSNGAAGFEIADLGEITGLTSPRSRTINTAGMTPGLKTVRARITDNGAMTGADNARRQVIATTQFLVDTPPVALPDDHRTVAGDSLPLVLAGTDVDDDDLGYSIVDQPEHGTLTGSGPNRVYTPDAGYAGIDTFTFRADDGYGGTSDAEVSVRVDPDVSGFNGPTGVQDSRAGEIEFDSSVSGASFECQLDNQAWEPCTSPWALTDLTEGEHTMRTRVTANSLTNPDSTVATWTVDAFPKIAVDDGPAADTNQKDASVDFSLSEHGATVLPTSECRLDAHAWAPCTSPVTYEDLDDGDHTISIRATDAHGKQTIEEINWNVSTAGAQTTIDGETPPAFTRETSASIGFSASGSVSGFECSLDGAGWTSCSSPTQLTGLDDGHHTFRIRAVDSFGEPETLPAQISWTVDRTIPVVKVNSGPDGAVPAGAAAFSFTSNESFSTFECKLDQGDYTACVSPMALPADLADGDHVFRVAAIDRAGNRSLAARREFKVLSVAPEVVLTDGPAQGELSKSNAASFGFSTTPAAAAFECRVDEGDWKPCVSPTSVTGLGDGARSFAVRAIDEVGNRSAAATTRDWTIDTVAPETTITEGPAANSKSTTAEIQFSSSEPNSSFECALDDGAFTACTSPVRYENLADGPHQVRIRATDLAGNRDLSPASRNWHVDSSTLPPPDPTDPPDEVEPCDFKLRQDRCDDPYLVASAKAPFGRGKGKGVIKAQLSSGGPALSAATVRFAPGVETIAKRGKGTRKIGRVVFTGGDARKVIQLRLPKGKKKGRVVAGQGSTTAPRAVLAKRQIVLSRIPTGTTDIKLTLRSGKRLRIRALDCGPRLWSAVLTDFVSNQGDVSTRDDVTCIRKGSR